MTSTSIRAGTQMRVTALVTVAALLAGCHVQTRVAIPGESPPSVEASAATVKAGDDVRIVMRDGTVAGVTVADARPDALIGTRGQRYPFAEMVRLEKREVSVGRTAGAAAGIVAAALGLFIVLMLAAGWEIA